MNDAMLLLAAQPRSLFIGQGVVFGGVATYAGLEGVPMEQRIEFPVAEELNVGAAIGLSLQGFLPVVCIPRMDFLLRAMDQIVNHLDKLAEMSCGQFLPKAIIRTRIGQTWPLNAGPQHSQDHTDAFRRILTTVQVWRIDRPQDIMPTYRDTVESDRSVIVIEAITC